jgi:hypothetical protein
LRLSEKELRQFVLNDGVDVYDRTRAAERPADTERSPREIELEANVARLQGERDAAEMAKKTAAYEQARTTEMQALWNEYPDLRFQKADPTDAAYRKTLHIAEIAEARTKDNYERGIAKVVSYKEVATELNEIMGRATPPGAPATSRDQIPQTKPQAPTSAVESKQRMKDTIERAGGFRNLAAASSRRG